MKQKHWAIRFKQFLEQVSIGMFMLISGLVFVFAAGVALTLVWLYTRD